MPLRRSACSLVLDALGHRLEPERVRELDDRLHDGGVLGARHDAVDEGLVDLQRVDRQQLAQVAQRGVADAEVVDRQAHAELLELAQRRGRGVHVGEHGALGDLQAQLAGTDARRGDRRGDRSRKSAAPSWRGETLTAIVSSAVAPGGRAGGTPR